MLSLDDHLVKIKETLTSINTLYFRPPGIFTNAVIGNPEITTLIRDLEQPEKGIFRVVPIGSGAEKKRTGRKRKMDGLNVNVTNNIDFKTDHSETNTTEAEESLTSAVMRGGYDIGYGFYDEVEEMRPAESSRTTIMTAGDQSAYLKKRMDQLIESILREVDPNHSWELSGDFSGQPYERGNSHNKKSKGDINSESGEGEEVKFGNVNVLVTVIERLKELYNPHGSEPDISSGVDYDPEIIQTTIEFEKRLKEYNKSYQEAISGVFEKEQLREKLEEKKRKAPINSRGAENKWVGRSHGFQLNSESISSMTFKQADEAIKAYEEDISRMKAQIETTRQQTTDLQKEG
ncbi:hypothetical protein NADFUDRAFT_40965 [Nadsonia fulvescens var. elongata DSM 6958]|uniref:DASH complex subunit SPC34 n=1 Tax=Nadsonia fulvescens var. elongata DSM 6958 TaxID=857566 RepID=A0A1E3PMA3_9ASCO|nr:hypothetical protein NADFUDRAFT_40965 [Nadsonia fulvescens var. elongata DSM 6958]